MAMNLLGEVPKEDSEDLTDEEVLGALDTKDSNDFVRVLEEQIRPLICPNVGGSIKSHELRRRNPHLFCRTRLLLPSEPDKVLLLRVDWLDPWPADATKPPVRAVD